VSLARSMGIESPLQAVPALSLGAGGEVTPLEMASAFSTFPNQGIHVEPNYINKIEDQFGNLIVAERKSTQASDVLPKKIANEMISMMSGVVNGGTGYKVREYFKGVAAAGKTGTTNDFADAWFIGYTPQLVCGIWVGFDDRRITFTGGYGYAATAAAPLFGILMNKIYSDPKLPYKQKEFTFALDSAFQDSLRRVSAIPEPPNTQVSEAPKPVEKPAPSKDVPKKDDNTKHKFPALPKKQETPEKKKNTITNY
jgi:membrane peptidoglycan carboxypeptidase